MAEIKQLNEIELNNNLTSIADNIRDKLNIYNKLIFPDDFLENLENIYSLEDLVQHKLKEGPLYLKEATQIGMASFSNTNITEIHAPRVTRFYSNTDSTGVSPFQRCTKLTLIDMPNLSGCGSGGYQFSNCTGLISVFLPKFSPGQYCFNGCSNLENIYLGGTGRMNQCDFYNCSKLIVADVNTSGVYNSSFSGCSKLTTLILRNSSIASLSSTNAFTNTPFASGKAGGTLYVPAALIDSYKAATNWKTILGYLKADGETLQNQILPIEGSYWETHYGTGKGMNRTVRLFCPFPYTNKNISIEYNNSYVNTFNFAPYNQNDFTVKILMNNIDITNQVYSTEGTIGTINIEHVTHTVHIFIEKILPLPNNSIQLFENINMLDAATGGTITTPENGWKQFTSSANKSWQIYTQYKDNPSLFIPMSNLYKHTIRIDLNIEWINYVSEGGLYITYGSFRDINTTPLRTSYNTQLTLEENKNFNGSILIYLPDNKYEWHSVMGDSSSFPEDTDYLSFRFYFYSNSGGSIKINSINIYDLGILEESE